MLIDTHCHLDATEFEADRDLVVAAAQAAGVGRIVVPGVSIDNLAAVNATAARYPMCRVAYGIHPLYAMSAAEAHIDQLDAHLRATRPLAVGEIGLDHFVTETDPERQAWFFQEQLKLARAHDLPVLLHVRRAIDPVLALLRRIRVPGGIAHAFNGSRQQAEIFIALGFKLGFGGTMTYPGSRRIRALAATLPLEHIVLETDAPDIPPAWQAGRRNSPAELPRIAATLAELRGMATAEVIDITGQAARDVLPGL